MHLNHVKPPPPHNKTYRGSIWHSGEKLAPNIRYTTLVEKENTRKLTYKISTSVKFLSKLIKIIAKNRVSKLSPNMFDFKMDEVSV